MQFLKHRVSSGCPAKRLGVCVVVVVRGAVVDDAMNVQFEAFVDRAVGFALGAAENDACMRAHSATRATIDCAQTT